jgi:hypothetical protein
MEPAADSGIVGLGLELVVLLDFLDRSKNRADHLRGRAERGGDNGLVMFWLGYASALAATEALLGDTDPPETPATSIPRRAS